MSLVQTPVNVIGGQGGTAFNYNQSNNGQVLSKIGVWAGGWQLRGIRIWMTGSDSPVTFGSAEEEYAEYDFADGETITKLSLWGNGAGTRTGGIRFNTSTGGTFKKYMTDWELKQEYPIDVASGLCVGITGRSGADIDCLGFYFLLPITFGRLINVSYPTLALETTGIVPIELDSYSSSNDSGNTSEDWYFSGSQQVSTSSSWTLTNGVEAYAKVSVQAGVPKIAEVKGEFQWKESSTASYTTTHEETRTLNWQLSGTQDPGQQISLQATTRSGNITVPFEGTMEITLNNGTVFSYPISSTYSGVDYTGVGVISTGGRGLGLGDAQATDEQAQEGDPDIQPNKEVQEDTANSNSSNQ